MEYSFQAKQPLSVYFNGEIKATTFVKKSTRKAKRLWSIQSEDYIGLMDSMPFYGGIYNNKNVVELLNDIFEWQEETQTTKIPYKLDEVFADATVTGYIPFTTCRDALMQVAFAIQAVVDTTNSEVVKVFALEEDVKQTIPLIRFMQGQNFADEETVTAISIVSHSYRPIRQTLEAYNAQKSGTGKNIFVNFSEPLHTLKIGYMEEDEDGEYFVQDNKAGEIVSYESNYAIININENGVLLGRKYEHTTQTHTRKNPTVLTGEMEKNVAVENATLVSQHNIDNVLEKCYNWLVRTNSVNLSIVEGKHVVEGEKFKWGTKKWGTFKWGEKYPDIVTYDEPVNVGDNINAETEYLGVVSGRLIKQSFNLNGNIIVKEAVLK